MPTLRRLAAAATAAILAASIGTGAHAASTGGSPNHTFADGSEGFAFTTTGGFVNPEVLVGFNPQPDPPGFVGDLDLTPGASTHPEIFTPAGDAGYSVLIALLGVGPDAQEPLPAAPNGDGNTGLTFLSDGVVYTLNLHFEGPGSEIDWAAFNPQPDPPGVWFGAQFSYPARGDPTVTVSLTENDQPLSFTLAPVPEPAAWALMLAGAGGIGGLARRRRAATIVASLA